eukprot:g28030.t1
MISFPRLRRSRSGALSYTQDEDKPRFYFGSTEKNQAKLELTNWKGGVYKNVPRYQMLSVISPDELANGFSVGQMNLEKRESGACPISCIDSRRRLRKGEALDKNKKCLLNSTQ